MKNPSAFPSPGVVMSNDRQQGCYEGMTLRDYFAAAAMQAIIIANGAFDYDKEPDSLHAYKYADAMLKERERES